MPRQFNKSKLKKAIALGISTAIVTTSTPLDIINAQINNKESKAIKEVEKISNEVEKEIAETDIINLNKTDELPFTEIGIKDRNDMWEGDDINISTKIDNSDNISKVEVKYTNDNYKDEYTVNLSKHPYKENTFENPSIKTDVGNYKASEIIFYEDNSQTRKVERDENNESVFSAFDYNVNEHKIEDIEISKTSGIIQGDRLEFKVAISGAHKIDDIRVNYNDGLSGKGIFDKNEKKFIGYIDIYSSNNYELNRIGINKTKGTISKHRNENKELFSKVDFVANEYAYPIENIEIDNKDNLYYLDKISARAKLFDKIDPSDIDEIIIRYDYDGDRSIKLKKNNKNEFVGETYIQDQFKKVDSIRIKRNNGNYINYDREKIDNADNLDINPNLPMDSININNKQDNYYMGEEISVTASNVRENIDNIKIKYENKVSVYLDKDNNFNNNMILSKSGDYKIESIYLEGKSEALIYRDEIPQEILDSLEFKATSYNMPISSIDIEKKKM